MTDTDLKLIRQERLYRQMGRADKAYALLQDGDRVLLALSGGKDSWVMACLMAARARVLKPHITVEVAHVVAGHVPYESNLPYMQTFCQELGLPFHVLHTDGLRPGSPMEGKTPCVACALGRRQTLFRFATDHGFTKVALGHHRDDILATLLMNLTFEGSFQTMAPRLRLTRYPLSVIRPLCLASESELTAFAQRHAYHPQFRRCPYEDATRRTTMQRLLLQLEQINPEARYSLWKAAEETFACVAKKK